MNTCVMVPGTESMDSIVLNWELDPYGTAQRTDVSVDHSDVAQLETPITPVGVESLNPKFLPLKVTIVPPDEAPFCARTKETTGESNENTPKRVPTRPLMVARIGMALPNPSSRKHAIDVAEFQVDVAQGVYPTAAVTVRSVEAKFKPVTVMLTPADAGAFEPWEVTTGAS